MATYNGIKKIKIGNNIFNFYSDYLSLTGGQVTGPVTFGDAITIDEATIGDLVVNGSASFTNNISANTISVTEFTVDTIEKGNIFRINSNGLIFSNDDYEKTYISLDTTGSNPVFYIKNLSTPTSDYDAATKKYVDEQFVEALSGQTNSSITDITATTTATKTTLGTAFTIPNITSAGSASTWVFENIACDDITSWSAGSGSYTQGSFSGGSGSFNATVTNHVLSFSHTHTAATHGTDSHSHTAPSLSYTARTVSSKKSGGNGSAPTLGTAFSVPNVTSNTSATVSITDNGHRHTYGVS